jgi:hypothetical protein
MELQNKIPMSKRFFPAIRPILGSDRYLLLGLKYIDVYQAFTLPQNPVLRHHLIDGILPGFALYQNLLEEGNTKQEALAQIDDIFEKLFQKSRNKMKKLGRLPFVYPFLRKYIKTAMKEYPEEGWKIDWTQNNQEAIRFNMKSCYYFDTLSKLGVPELTASFCRVDDFIYTEMSPSIEWQRTQTIANGSTYCDFCFAAVKK